MAARQRLQELFEKYDTSGDGTLSEEEMAKAGFSPRMRLWDPGASLFRTQELHS